MKFCISGLVLLTLLASSAWGQGEPKGDEGKKPEQRVADPDRYLTGMAAQVNRQVITKGEVWESIRSEVVGVRDPEVLEQQFNTALMSTVRQALIDQQADRLKLSVDDRYIRGSIERHKEDLGGDQAYRDWLLERGQTEQDYMDSLKRQSSRTFLLRTKAGIGAGLGPQLRPEFDVNPTVKEVREFYRRHKKDQFTTKAEREIWFMAITIGSTGRKLPDGKRERGTIEKAKALADRIRAELLTGADFGTLAERYSPATADKKGYFGMQERETSALSEKLLEWAFAEERVEEEVSPPITFGGEIPRGYLLVKVGKIARAGVIPFSEAQKAISSFLRQRRSQEAILQIQAQLAEEAYIWPPKLKSRLVNGLRLESMRARKL